MIKIFGYLIVGANEVESVITINDNYIKIRVRDKDEQKSLRKYLMYSSTPTINIYIRAKVDMAFKWLLKKFGLYKYSVAEIIENGELQCTRGVDYCGCDDIKVNLMHIKRNGL